MHMRQWFWLNGEILQNKYFQYFDRSKTRHDQAKIGLAGQHDRRPLKNNFEPWSHIVTQPFYEGVHFQVNGRYNIVLVVCNEWVLYHS